MNSFVNYLDPAVASSDSGTFKRWENKQITTAKALMEFKIHNKIDLNKQFDEQEFENWLRSLGYIRG